MPDVGVMVARSSWSIEWCPGLPELAPAGEVRVPLAVMAVLARPAPADATVTRLVAVPDDVRSRVANRSGSTR